MKSQASENMKKYRDALKAKDKAAYLLKQRLQKQKYRASKKMNTPPNSPEEPEPEPPALPTTPVPPPPLPESLPALPESLPETAEELPLKNLVNEKSADVEPKTLARYMKNIRFLSKKITNGGSAPHDGFDGTFPKSSFDNTLAFLYDTDSVTNFINTYTNFNTKSTYYKSIVGVIRRLNFSDALCDKYSALMMSEKKKNDKLVGENTLSKSELLNFVEWNEILNMDTTGLTPTEYLLYILYTALPPRRLDFKYLKLIKLTTEDPSPKLSKKFNYLIINSFGIPSKLIYNNYKTSKIYGQFVIDLNLNDKTFFYYSLVREAVINWLKTTETQTDELIFPTLAGEVYDDFSRTINKVFKYFQPKYAGSAPHADGFSEDFSKSPLISANILRHSFLTHVHNQSDITSNTLKDIAQYMSNSVTGGLDYRKFKIV